MSYVDPKTMTDPHAIKARIAELRKLIRRTEWRSEAYRSKVQIEQLQEQLKKLKEAA